MPKVKVWYKRTVRTADGTLEIGLGGEYPVERDASAAEATRRKHLEACREEVEQLLAIEEERLRLETSQSDMAAMKSGKNDPESRSGQNILPPPIMNEKRARVIPQDRASPFDAPEPGDERPAEPPVSPERSREVLAELKQRLEAKVLSDGKDRPHLGKAMDELLRVAIKGGEGD